MRLAVSSRNGTSRAKMAPVAGVLKMAATPAAAPATMSTFTSVSRNSRRNRVCRPVPIDRPDVDRRPFEAERATGAECGDRSDDPSDRGSQVERVGLVVEVPDVLVRGGGAGAGGQPPQGERSDDQAHAGSDDLHGDRQVVEVVEGAPTGDPLEAGDRESGRDTGDRRQQEDLPRPSREAR